MFHIIEITYKQVREVLTGLNKNSELLQVMINEKKTEVKSRCLTSMCVQLLAPVRHRSHYLTLVTATRTDNSAICIADPYRPLANNPYDGSQACRLLQEPDSGD